MFKIFITFLFFFISSADAFAQTNFSASKDEQEKTLFKYINASAVCAKMTDSTALYERAMLLLSDANDEAYLAAADCFTSAAMKNHTPSQLELGKLYENGNGVSKSNVYAYKWYQTAVLLGNHEAIAYRDKLEARMTLDEISAANPLIQNTLSLINSLNEWKERQLQDLEKKVVQQYRKFNIDLEQFEEKNVEKKEISSNPLIDALIQEQQKKEEDLKKQKALQKMAEEMKKSKETEQQQQPGRPSLW